MAQFQVYHVVLHPLKIDTFFGIQLVMLKLISKLIFINGVGAYEPNQLNKA